ncbi:helix-turn-helix transcriptional regulator [Mycolicibacterium chubuense]|uniref:helix-turn-helix transcriptional regulator n=1 Tax=Mycolicibacterium chubuense TaxID=1800 RepID=UPI001F20BF21|nr:LuxR family transcriptional regulator [Mycolicibacterium chubuense]
MVNSIVTAIPDPSTAALAGRDLECRALGDLVDALRSGRSEVRVLQGEAGIGKTALLRYLREYAANCTVLSAVGVESDMDLAFAGLQQLCAPVLHHRAGLSQPQRDALEQAFGLSSFGIAPDRFLVGLAVLGLLAAAAADRPVLCVVDDVQWLDQVSAQTLFFVARRLQAESVGLVFALRSPIDGTAGLPTLIVGGLDDRDARSLLESAFPGRLDAAVVDRIVAESRGNPLALLESPKYVDAFDAPAGTQRVPVSAGVEQHYRQLINDLPVETRMFLHVAAAEPVGDPALLTRALAHLGLEISAMAPAQDAELIHVDTRVQFHHPLARSVAYRSASLEQRRAAHGALAAVTDPLVDPDRRAWHRALAVASVDEDVALDLEQSADRARQRGGTASAAAFLTRAVELTPDPAQRSVRALAAAEAHREIASFDTARHLLATAERGPLSGLQRARLGQLRTRLEFAGARASGDAETLAEAVTQFTAVARQLEALDAELAVEAYLEALCAAMYVGRSAPTLIADVAASARAALTTSEPRTPIELLTRALAERFAIGAAEAMPAMRRALEAIKESARAGGAGWFWRGFPIAHESLIHETWDDGWQEVASYAVRSATGSGALALVPAALSSRAGAHVELGELASASSLIAEANDLSIAINYTPLKYHRMVVAAWQGDESEVTRLATAAIESGRTRGEGRVAGLAHYATAVVNNGLGRYAVALGAARTALEYDDFGFRSGLLVEAVEAAVRADDRVFAQQVLGHLQERARAAGTPRALGALARSRALLSDGRQAEALYLESITHFEATNQLIHLARARLVYGEWLRRNAPATIAREPLRIAHQAFVQMGSAAFAERARRELQAAGQKIRKQPTSAGEELSPQEHQIAELAGQGLTNQEIAGQLFISAHTVEWHLRKVFTKLGIRSRRDLRRRLG